MTNLPKEIIENIINEYKKQCWSLYFSEPWMVEVLQKHLSLPKQETRIYANIRLETEDWELIDDNPIVYWSVRPAWWYNITKIENSKQEDTLSDKIHKWLIEHYEEAEPIEKIGNNYIDKTWNWFTHSLIDSNIWDTIQYQHHWYTIVCKKITPQ